MKTKHLILIALAFMMASCVKTKNYYVNNDNRDWFADTANCRFTMQDDNWVSYSFRMEPVWQNMLENSTSILFVQTERSMHEELYQNGTSSYSSSLRFGLEIEAYKHDEEHEGSDLFMMYFGNSRYDMRIDGNRFYTRGCYDTSFDVGKMEYEAEYIYKYCVHDVEYQDVMHLKLKDAAYPQTKNFPTEIYYAKHYGLIKCTLDDMLSLYRLPD